MLLLATVVTFSDSLEWVSALQLLPEISNAPDLTRNFHGLHVVGKVLVAFPYRLSFSLIAVRHTLGFFCEYSLQWDDGVNGQHMEFCGLKVQPITLIKPDRLSK